MFTKVLAAGTLLGLSGSALAQNLHAAFAQPSLDRWMYPFNQTPGRETLAPSFGAILQTGFDDRDAQFIVGFNSGGQVPAGLGAASYHLVSARLTVVVMNDLQVRYDESWDSVTSLYDVGDPQYVADTDAGRPIEVFAAGYRNGQSLAGFIETSPFGGAPINSPAEGARNVFAATIDENGVATDVSRQVRLRFDAMPLAIGTTTDVAPGDLIPAGTVITFDLLACNAEVGRHFASSLNAGKINLVVTSLEPASGGPGGGTGDPTYPVFSTKEGTPGYTATLTLDVRVGEAADFDGDGTVDFFDYDAFVAAFEAGDPSADFDQDCTVDFFDYDAFVVEFIG
ncbi:MAG: hypothetical protein AABZ53_15495 [Planctomycetota bacterium]